MWSHIEKVCWNSIIRLDPALSSIERVILVHKKSRWTRQLVILTDIQKVFSGRKIFYFVLKLLNFEKFLGVKKKTDRFWNSTKWNRLIEWFLVPLFRIFLGLQGHHTLHWCLIGLQRSKALRKRTQWLIWFYTKLKTYSSKQSHQWHAFLIRRNNDVLMKKQ